MPQINPATLAGADPILAPPISVSVRHSVRQSVRQSIHRASVNLVDDEAAALLHKKGKKKNETPSIPLSDKPIHNIKHISWTNFFGIVAAVPALGLIHLSGVFAKYVSETHRVSRPYIVTILVTIFFEIFGCIMFGSKSKSYRDRHLYCQWPIWFLLTTGTMYTVALLNDGKMGYFAIPVSLLGFSLSKVPTKYYQIYKGENVECSLLKNLKGSFLQGFVIFFTFFGPIWGQLLPVNSLAGNYPLANMAVTGFGLPAFTFTCKKYVLAYTMAELERKVKAGELPVSQLLLLYATFSQVISV